MKKEYQKPILEIKAYAQFENVFTNNCTNNKNVSGCEYVLDSSKISGVSYTGSGSLKS